MGATPKGIIERLDGKAGELYEDAPGAVIVMGNLAADLDQVIHPVEVGVSQLKVVRGVVAPERFLEVVVQMVVAVPMGIVLNGAREKQSWRCFAGLVGAAPGVERLVPETLGQGIGDGDPGLGPKLLARGRIVLTPPLRGGW